MLRVALINPPQRGLPIDGVPFSEEVVPPSALLALAAVLPRDRFATSIVDLNLDVALERLRWDNTFFDVAVRAIVRDTPDIIGFTAYGNNYPIVRRLAALLRKESAGAHALTVVGGPQASAVPEATLRWSEIDAVVVGEGEYTFLDLCEAIEQHHDLSEVRGLVYRHDGRPCRTGSRTLCNMETLPFPALDLLDLDAYAGFNDYRFPYDVGRGCPFACSFCSTSMTYGRRFRMKSAAQIARELERLMTEFGLRRFWFTHDLFTTNREVVAQICRAIRDRGIDPLWKCYSRADTLDPETLRTMNAAGCEEIFFGVESGSMRIQRELNKRLDVTHGLDIIKEAARVLRAVPVGMIAGAPSETRDDLEATMRTSLQLKLCWISRAGLNMLIPLSGTAIATEKLNDLILPLQRSDCPPFLYDTYDDIAADREAFTYYYHVPTPAAPYEELRDKIDAFNELILRWFPHATAHLVASEQMSIGGILDLWRVWCDGERFDNRIDRAAAFQHFLSSIADSDIVAELLEYDKGILAARRNLGETIVRSFRHNVHEIAEALRTGAVALPREMPRTLCFTCQGNTYEVEVRIADGPRRPRMAKGGCEEFAAVDEVP